jgi:hypothetical protein
MSGNAGWVGVDLDATLAEYHGWKGAEVIGEPIPIMLKYVQELLYQGIEVRIFTARVQEGARAIRAIEEWCVKHIGQVLKITATKDMNMVFCVDDRAVSVQRNTGVFLVTPPSVESIHDHWNDPNAPPKEFKHD